VVPPVKSGYRKVAVEQNGPFCSRTGKFPIAPYFGDNQSRRAAHPRIADYTLFIHRATQNATKTFHYCLE
jgi:hypothetical protein